MKTSRKDRRNEAQKTQRFPTLSLSICIQWGSLVCNSWAPFTEVKTSRKHPLSQIPGSLRHNHHNAHRCCQQNKIILYTHGNNTISTPSRTTRGYFYIENWFNIITRLNNAANIFNISSWNEIFERTFKGWGVKARRGVIEFKECFYTYLRDVQKLLNKNLRIFLVKCFEYI